MKNINAKLQTKAQKRLLEIYDLLVQSKSYKAYNARNTKLFSHQVGF